MSRLGRRQRLALTLATTVACLFAAAASASIFQSPDGLFTVEFPGAPKLWVADGRTARGTGFEERRWSVATKDGYFSVTAFVYAKPQKTDFDAAASAAAAGARGRVVAVEPIRQGEVDGREIAIDCGASGFLRERIMSVGGVFYVVLFQGADATSAKAAAVDEFLISFEAAG